ncbi:MULTISPECIES: virulence factor SrfC family protein [unclassified Serratia (in: enterobacteria)]|uniref:virulence factor SrfC family protein n=1 Tax=unclassified Serratia (in: enterobacteria) TaxID=2647522 RepID=UPI0030763B2E
MKSSISRLSDVIDQALAWVEDTRQQVPRLALEAQALTLSLRRSRIKFHQLAAAAGKQPTLGFYGRSQAAKMHLISALASAEPGYLTTCFAGKTLDFLSHIQPDGPSAAIAIRFSAHLPPQHTDYPVQLTLMTEAELVRMLAKACPAAPALAWVADEWKTLTKLRQAQAVAGISADDAVALWDALQRDASPLPAEYGAAMVALAPYLTIDDRARLFSPLWHGDSELTECYRRLAYRLQQLGNIRLVTAPLSLLSDEVQRPANGIFALTPSDETLLVRPLGANPVSIPLADLRWLTAEVLIPLQAPATHPGLAHCDFLDLPGYGHSPLLQAKSLCLLERYSEQRAIHTLLLCNAAASAEEATAVGRALDFWQQQMRGKNAKRTPGLIWAFTAHDRRTTTRYDEAVQRYVGEPGEAWGSLLARDEDELQRMADYLATELNCAEHQHHLAQQLTQLRHDVLEKLLGRWHKTEHGDKAPIAKATVKALQARLALHGELLEHVLPSRQRLRQLYRQQHVQQLADPIAPALDLFDDQPAAVRPCADNAGLAHDVQSLWINHLRALAGNAALLELLAIAPATLETLADELITASFRLDLWSRLATTLAEAERNGHQRENPIERQIACVLTVLGDFVAWLGFPAVEPALRPASRINQGQPIFTQPDYATGSRLTQLPGEPVNTTAIYIYDWLVGLHALICANAGYGVAEALNAAQRERLGGIIQGLREALPKESALPRLKTVDFHNVINR